MSSKTLSLIHSEASGEDFSFFEALTFEPQKGPFRLSTAALQSEAPPVPLKKPAQYSLTPTVQTSLPPLPPLVRSLPPVPTSKEAERPLTAHANRKPVTISSPEAAAKMSPSLPKGHVKCLELCHTVTTSGDRISVHMLEYLTTVKSVQPSVDHLAHAFLDTCQILFTLDAGLSESGRSAPTLPADMISELDKKLRVAQSDFLMLDSMLLRLLDYERGGSMGKMKKGLGKMFGDSSPDKVAAALERTKTSLNMAALLFQYSVGDKLPVNKGIGFTGLAAALDRLDGNSAQARPSEATSQYAQSHSNGHSHSNSALNSHSQRQASSPPSHWGAESQHHLHTPVTWSERGSSKHESGSTAVSSILSPMHAHDQGRHYSVTSGSSINSNDRVHHDKFERLSAIDDNESVATGINDEQLLEDLAGLDLGSDKVVRVKVDPSAMPRWSPRGNAQSDTGSMKSGLISAIRQKNHKTVESLLDRGVSPNCGMEMPALHEAIHLQDAESVRLLLLFGADQNEPDHEGNSPLYAAVQKSFLAGAVTLLKYGAEVNILNGPDFESPLAAAAVAGRVSLAHLLLIYGGDQNQVLSDGNTLMTACIDKKTPRKLIDLILDYGADPNAKNRMGQTALFKAIEACRVDLVETLLKHEADPNLPGPKHLLWPATMYSTAALQLLLSHGADSKKAPGIMELAASINNLESVKVLMKAGVNPNTKKDSVYTPLCSAIRDNRPEIIDYLLKNGADPNTPASEYPAFKCITHKRQHFLPTLVAAGADLNSPKGIVEQAVASNNMEALKWLLDQGIDPNIRNAKGCSALTTAIRESRAEMVDVLLERGADPNKRGQDWPLCMAVKNPVILRRILSVLAEPRAFKGVMEMAVSANQLESVKQLLAAGVSVEDRNGGVFSPLTTAIREDYRDIVYFLINEAGADVNAPGEHLPIIKALRRLQGEDTSIIELLLAKGADPNQMYRGWNAVIQAIQNGDLDVLKLVTAKRVDLNVKDDLGRTVVEMASSRGWDEGVKVLMEAGGRQ